MPPGDAGWFAADLLLRLAAEGRLVLAAEDADRLAAGLERTIAAVEARALLLDGRGTGRDELTAAAVDAVLADQVAPGLLHQARRELPRYLAAVRAAGAAAAADRR